MNKRIFQTTPSAALLIIRVTVGGVMLLHGLQKTAGLFGGYGFSGTMKFFTETLHIPYLFALAAILTESLGSVLLIAGFLTRPAALALAVLMAVAMVKGGHLANGIFMNWFGNQKGEGYEYHLLVLAISLALLIAGGGAASVDLAFSRKTSNTSSPTS